MSTRKSEKKHAKTVTPDICIAIKRVRQAFGDSQERFAQRLQIAVMTVSRFELGKKVPRDSQILRRLQTLANEKGLTDEAALFETAFEQTAQRQKPVAITFSTPELACSMALDIINEMVILRTGGTLSLLEDAWLHRSLGEFWYALRQEMDGGWPGSAQRMATAAQALDSIRQLRIEILRRATQNLSADDDAILLNHLEQILQMGIDHPPPPTAAEILNILQGAKQDRIKKAIAETELRDASTTHQVESETSAIGSG
jgi:transcriptional regulator with XRE-family HTH domain